MEEKSDGRIKKGEHLSSQTEFEKGRKATNKKELSKEELITLYWSEGKGQKEIAEIFNMTSKTILTRMQEYGIHTRNTKFKKGAFKGKTYEERYGIETAKEMKKRLSELHMGKNNPSYGKTPWNKGKRLPSDVVYKMLLRRTPNKEESFLITFFNYHNIPYAFVGDGKVIIEGRNPDFINSNGEKKIIEFFGEHWHKEEDEEIKRKIYARYGFNLLVIWGKELRNEEKLLEKICNFNKKEVI